MRLCRTVVAHTAEHSVSPKTVGRDQFLCRRHYKTDRRDERKCFFRVSETLRVDDGNTLRYRHYAGTAAQTRRKRTRLCVFGLYERRRKNGAV